MVLFGDGVSTLLISDGSFNLGVLAWELCESGGLKREAIMILCLKGFVRLANLEEWITIKG